MTLHKCHSHLLPLYYPTTLYHCNPSPPLPSLPRKIGHVVSLPIYFHAWHLGIRTSLFHQLHYHIWSAHCCCAVELHILISNLAAIWLYIKGTVYQLKTSFPFIMGTMSMPISWQMRWRTSGRVVGMEMVTWQGVSQGHHGHGWGDVVDIGNNISEEKTSASAGWKW